MTNNNKSCVITFEIFFIKRFSNNGFRTYFLLLLLLNVKIQQPKLEFIKVWFLLLLKATTTPKKKHI